MKGTTQQHLKKREARAIRSLRQLMLAVKELEEVASWLEVINQETIADDTRFAICIKTGAGALLIEIKTALRRIRSMR